MLKRVCLLTIIGMFLLTSTESLAQEAVGDPTQGEAIYQKNCVKCHGLTGKGDGPEASSLMIPPANFQTQESRSRSDSELRSAIVWGFAFSPMHGWLDRLTSGEIRSVVQYIRRIAPFQPQTQSP